ncbi:MAG: M1 family aminopeptidase [Bacteroidota bacterium]
MQIKITKHWVLLALALACKGKPEDSPITNSDGKGWNTVEMDIHVQLVPGKPPEAIADLTVQLGGEVSYGPSFILNSIGKTAAFGAFDLSGHSVSVTTVASDFGYAEYCHVRSDTLYRQGDLMQLSIPVSFLNSGNLLHFWSEDFAMTSWVNVWYPTPIGEDIDASWARMKAPGKMIYTLPKTWEVVSSGELDSVIAVGNSKQSIWVLDGAVARSFAAGPFQKVVYDPQEGKSLTLAGHRSVTGQEERVEAFIQSIEVLEGLFGPAPYPYHSIVEVPSHVPGFYGASEQNYILLKTEAFDDQLSSLPVLAHEAAHAWWAIAVGVELDGYGGLFMTEAMAQYSAVLAIEKVHGIKAAKDFLWSGEGGFSRNHDAQAYRRLVDERRDVPLITQRLGSADQHYVADSKGAWVYHMLRKKMGDDAFFKAVREIVLRYRNKTITLAEWCATFNQATPIDLTRFFQQWLEWEGAPILEIAFARDRKGAIISQVQDGGVYELDLELDIQYEDGSEERRRFLFDQQRTAITSTNGQPFKTILVDPDRDLLRLPSH